jgi:flagellar biosynthesis protein FliR
VSDQPAPRRIDVRGPRFAAGITALLLLVDVFLGLVNATVPAFLLLAVIAALFLWGVVSPRTAPWGALYRTVVQPRLRPATEFEDPRPPRFAQGVGLFVTVVGLVLHLIGVPWALPVAAAAAFMAAFLNAVFGLCLGCQLYLLLQRVGIVGGAYAAA